MGSEAVDIISKTNPWIVFMIIFGVLFTIQQSINLLKSLGEIFGIERKENIEKREMQESITKLSIDFKQSISSLSEKIEELKSENALFKKELQKQNDAFKTDIDNITKATCEELGDKINLKFKQYFELGYIPADEFDEFVNLHNAYKLVGGNHTGDAKYNKCISSLKVKDDSTPESRVIL